MEKRRGIRAFVCVVCIAFAAVSAFAIDVPEKLKSIPLYQGSKVEQSMDMAGSSMLIASVKAEGDAIANFYKNAMTSKGWKVVFQADREDVKVVHFQKDKQIFQVSIQNEKGKGVTTYNLVIASQDGQ